MTAASRRVPAEAVVVTYAQSEMLRLLAEDVPKADASEAGYRLFGTIVRAATGQRLTMPSRTVTAPTRCLTDSAAAIRDALAMNWETFVQQHGPFNPSVVLDEETITTLIWLTDAVVRVANGVDVLDAAVQARAAVAGKPRRKRKPAQRDWLAGQITGAQHAAWTAMIEQESWPRPLPAEPPAATVAMAATTERR
jgi:hypothetical protein